jgi:hypothetical protein
MSAQSTYRRIARLSSSGLADGQWQNRISAALFTLAILSPIRSLAASEPRTAADEAAEHEIAIATPEVDHMNRVLSGEMPRLLGETGGPQSPEVAKYLDGSSLSRVDLGDVRIALHLRFIERQRREFVAGVALANARWQVIAGIQVHEPINFLTQNFAPKYWPLSGAISTNLIKFSTVCTKSTRTTRQRCWN